MNGITVGPAERRFIGELLSAAANRVAVAAGMPHGYGDRDALRMAHNEISVVQRMLAMEDDRSES